MKLISIDDRRAFRLPKQLREQQIVTIELFAERRLRLHPGDELEASRKRAADDEAVYAETERALAMLLYPRTVLSGHIRLSRLHVWHLGAGEELLWQRKLGGRRYDHHGGVGSAKGHGQGQAANGLPAGPAVRRLRRGLWRHLS